MAEKRVRNVNWESDEKQLLREILKEYLPIMECRSNDTNAVQKKRKAWQDVALKFNALNGKQRDMKQLMLQWKTMKIRSKTEMSLFQRESRKTGGGPRPKSPSQEAIEILGMTPVIFYEDTSSYDSDLKKNDAPVASCSYAEPLIDVVDDESLVDAGSEESVSTPICVPPNPLLPPIAPANSTPKRCVSSARRSGSEFELKNKTFQAMELYRKREDARLQKEHETKMRNEEFRMQCFKTQHEKILRLMSLQEQILEKIIKERESEILYLEIK